MIFTSAIKGSPVYLIVVTVQWAGFMSEVCGIKKWVRVVGGG